MPSVELKNKLERYKDYLISKYGRTNRLPATIIGAEYNLKKRVAKNGNYPEHIAPKLRVELLKLGVLGTKGLDNYIGRCCEVRSSNHILITDDGINIDEVNFTNALRPRTGGLIRRCKNCQAIFG